jgi:hypothetical protein
MLAGGVTAMGFAVSSSVPASAGFDAAPKNVIAVGAWVPLPATVACATDSAPVPDGPFAPVPDAVAAEIVRAPVPVIEVPLAPSLKVAIMIPDVIPIEPETVKLGVTDVVAEVIRVATAPVQYDAKFDSWAATVNGLATE